ncbi:MAG: dynamin family protein, partial [Hyphomicrobiaceae bacterium]|nr:dynamin family protein [Hyphomicrobiaceae bacterium]
MGFEAPGLGDASPIEARSRRDDAIGSALETARVRLLDLLGRLGDLLGEHAAPLLDAARRQLNERTCRIAVVGQIKAGKSTFINALSRRPGLLPTDINPWTVVVTALNFRNGPTPPEHAAVFHLFSADEWRELAEGGGRLRELTERLVPGFQSDLLRAQLEVMRKRAERRLGPKFPELLGQCHRYPTVTPQILTDYVSAGDDDTWPGKSLHYSDITRSADLYFNDGPFAFPITLIDTPGTNDPFLVRDEITRRSLENPDIYVFVVSALQPLSAGDIALLRLLNGLHKDRIVVFINRADELPKLSSDAAVVKAAIETRLRAEFPSLNIPVVYGSAWLGNLRLQAEAGELAVVLPQRSLDPCQGSPPARRNGSAGAAPAETSGIEPARALPAVHMSSGMAEVSAAITKLMSTSSIAMLLRQIAVCLAELVRTADVNDAAERQSITDLVDARRQETACLRKRVAEEEKLLAEIGEHVKGLRGSFEEVEAHFKRVIATASRSLRNQLCGLVREFADKEAEVLLDALQEQPRQWTWRCDVLPLREDLEAVYLATFEHAAKEIDRVEQFLYPQLRIIVSSLLPNYRSDLLEVPAWPEGVLPSVAPLGDKVTMDLGVAWWRRWFASRKLAKGRANHLRCLIEEDFLQIAEELVSEAEAHLSERVDYIMGRVNAISNGLRVGVERRTANLAKEQELLNGAGDEHRLERFEVEQQQRASACAERQAAYAAVLAELQAVLDALDGA